MMQRPRTVRPFPVVCAFVIALLATGGRNLAAQGVKLYSEILPDGAASVGPDWAELVFPPLALSNTGCASSYAFPPAQEPMRVYYWGAQTRFIDAFTAPTDHFTTLGVRFELPARVPITDARLDSALALADLDVLEYSGEPPMVMKRTRPKHASARREGRIVRIRSTFSRADAMTRRTSSPGVRGSWEARRGLRGLPPKPTASPHSQRQSTQSSLTIRQQRTPSWKSRLRLGVPIPRPTSTCASGGWNQASGQRRASRGCPRDRSSILRASYL